MEVQTRDTLLNYANWLAGQLSDGLTLAECSAGLLRGLDLLKHCLQQCESDESIIAALDQMGEPTPEQMQMIAAIIPLVPDVLTQFIKTEVGHSLAAMPKGRTGRKEMTLQDKRALCRRITKLIGAGFSAVQAKNQVAASEGKSLRTINRIWRKRADYEYGMDAEQLQAAIAAHFKDLRSASVP